MEPILSCGILLLLQTIRAARPKKIRFGEDFSSCYAYVALLAARPVPRGPALVQTSDTDLVKTFILTLT